MTKAERILELEVENQKLKKDIQSLYGKLGNQGKEIARETTVAKLEAELNEIYLQLEALEGTKVTLRDEFAKAALSGMLAGSPEWSFPKHKDDVAKIAYMVANAMMGAR